MNKKQNETHNYVDFISDEHFLNCIESLYESYKKAKQKLSKSKFYKNKIDTVKLRFDSKFNQLSEEELVKAEISRQIDKSVNNAIGSFHENILGGIKGYEVGNLSGFDIKAEDDSLFADIKNKHNTMNSSSAESLFQKLSRYADDYREKDAKCYWVQILATKSFNEKWFSVINGKEYSHSRVYKISGDQFYALLSGNENAFFDLYKALPKAIDDFLKNVDKEDIDKDSILTEIKNSSKTSKRSILNEITFENFHYYSGFDKM